MRGRAANPLLWMVTLFLFAAVLFAGNHCALGGMKPAAGQEHSCCAPAPSPTTAPLEFSACCSPLEGAPPPAAMAPVTQYAVLGDVWFAPEVPLSLPREVLSWTAGLAHGPPIVSHFVQVVLCRSLPAHGPPVFVA